MSLAIQKLQSGRVNQRRLRTLATKLLRSEGCSLRCQISLVLAGDAFVQDLNRRYRGQDTPTDVLSFPQEEPCAAPDAATPHAPGAPRVLGDVVISLTTAQRQAGASGASLQSEVEMLLAHGILHLLGYDHDNPSDEAQMWARQQAVLTAMDSTAGAPRSSRKEGAGG